MIRVRLGDEVFEVEKVLGYPFIQRIAFYEKSVYHSITMESSGKVEEFLDQALRLGYIDFSKENIQHKTER